MRTGRGDASGDRLALPANPTHPTTGTGVIFFCGAFALGGLAWMAVGAPATALVLVPIALTWLAVLGIAARLRWWPAQTVLDTSAGTATVPSWWGGPGTSVPFSGHDRVRLWREVRREPKGGVQVRLVAELAGSGTPLSLFVTGPGGTAPIRVSAERVARFLGLPLHDETGAEPSVRQPAELDHSLAERARRGGHVPALAPPPGGVRLRATLGPGGATIVIPAVGLGCRPIATGVLSTLLIGVAVAIASASGLLDGPDAWIPSSFLAYLAPALPALIGILGLGSALHLATSSERIDVAREGLVVRRWRLIGPRTWRRRADEVEEMARLQVDTNANLGDLSPPSRQVAIQTDRGDVGVGWALDADEARWLRDTLHHYLAGGDGVARTDAPARPRTPVPADPDDAPDHPFVVRGEALVFPPNRGPRHMPRLSLGCLVLIAPMLVLPSLAGFAFGRPAGAAFGPLPTWASALLFGTFVLAWAIERAGRRCTFVLDPATQTGSLRPPFLGLPLRFGAPFRKFDMVLRAGLAPDGPRFRLQLGNGPGSVYESPDPAAAIRMGREIAARTGLRFNLPAPGPAPSGVDGPVVAYTPNPPDPGDAALASFGYAHDGDRLLLSTGRRLAGEVRSLGWSAAPSFAGCGVFLLFPTVILLIWTVATPRSGGLAAVCSWLAVACGLAAIGHLLLATRRREAVLDRSQHTVRARWVVAGLGYGRTRRLAEFEGVSVSSPTLEQGTQRRCYVVRLRAPDGTGVVLDVCRDHADARARGAAVAHFAGLPLLDEIAALWALLADARQRAGAAH